MFIYRAVNIYPSQIDIVLSTVDNVGSEYQIHLHHEETGRDLMTIKVKERWKLHRKAIRTLPGSFQTKSVGGFWYDAPWKSLITTPFPGPRKKTSGCLTTATVTQERTDPASVSTQKPLTHPREKP